MNLEFTSERLFLRPLSDVDLDFAIALLTDPEVAKYVGGVYTVEEVIEELPLVVRRCGGGCIGVWCVIDRETGEKLGTSVLLPMPIEEDDTNWDLVVGDEIPDCEIEIGYILKKSAWGKGYATEACARLMRFAFEETPLQELVATIDEENSASENVLKKTGFTFEGMGRAYAELIPIFRLTRQQWLARNAGTA